MAKWSRYNLWVRDDGRTLLFNTRTGALVRLDSERQRQLQEPDSIAPDFLQFLLQQGYLVSDDANELQMVADAHEAARNDRKTFSATIELTESCNFRCLYCYQTHPARHLNDRVFDRVLLYLSRKMREVHHLHVNWFGGEPLMRLAALSRYSRRLSDEARTAGCTLSQFITTNGYTLTPAVAVELAELGISNVQITVDGDQESHNRLRIHASGEGTYTQVLAACGNVVGAGMELLVRINVNRWNAQRIDALLADLAARGISPRNAMIHATRTVDHGTCSAEVSSAIFTPQEFAHEWVGILNVVAAYGFNLPTLAPIAYNCPFDLPQTVMIGSDGSIRHCSSSTGRIADLTETGDETNHSALYRAAKERGLLDDPDCRDCLYLPLCMGGCSYLGEIGQEKCIPERYILPALIMQTARRATTQRTGGSLDGRSSSSDVGSHGELL
jgi:uncharacterized protein